MAQPDFSVEDVDFDAFYRGEPPIKGVDVAFECTPWDIGEPQPALVALADSGALHGEILDSGCGPGDNAIFLAGRGYRVTGVDGAQPALDTARQRASEQGVHVEFVRAEVTTMEGIGQRFHTVLDSALYHCLSAEQRSDYAAALHRVTLPGAQLHLFCFADTGNEAFPLPMKTSQDDLHAHLGAHWTILDIEPADYATALTPDVIAASGFQEAGVDPDPAAIRTDDRGRALGRVWHLHAERA